MMPKSSSITRKTFFSIIRGGLSLGLLLYLFSSLDWQLVKSIVADTNPVLLCLSFLLVNASILLSAFKWKKILENLDRNVGLGNLAKLYYEGTFLNNFFPSNIGGDGFKFIQLSQQIDSRKDALVSIFVDRVSGLLVLALLTALSACLLLNMFSLDVTDVVYQYRGMSALIAVGVLVVCVLCFVFRDRVRSMHDKYVSERNLFTPSVLLVSVLFYLLVLANNYLIGVAYGLQISAIYYFIFMPIIMLLLCFPISLNGIGVREAAFVYLFGLVGVAKETAFLLGMTSYILLLATSLIGALSLAVGRKRIPT